MARIGAHGIEVELPAGWEGRIRRRETVDAADRPVLDARAALSPPAVAHLASFALPHAVADFGGGAVERMRGPDIFVSLIEHDASSAGTALFRRVGLPRSLRASAFDPQGLQRPLPGQGGTQVFFTTASGRPFCLYVVLGSYLRRTRTLPVVNELLAGIAIA